MIWLTNDAWNTLLYYIRWCAPTPIFHERMGAWVLAWYVDVRGEIHWARTMVNISFMDPMDQDNILDWVRLELFYELAKEAQTVDFERKLEDAVASFYKSVSRREWAESVLHDPKYRPKINPLTARMEPDPGFLWNSYLGRPTDA